MSVMGELSPTSSWEQSTVDALTAGRSLLRSMKECQMGSTDGAMCKHGTMVSRGHQGKESSREMSGIWMVCRYCGEFWCRIHNKHAHECDCPDTVEYGEMGVCPYSTDIKVVKDALNKVNPVHGDDANPT